MIKYHLNMVIRPPRVCYQGKHFISWIMKTFVRRFHTKVCVYMRLVNETHCDPLNTDLIYIYEFTDLYSDEVWGFEVIGWTATPVHYVLILALAAQLPVPVGHTQVIVNQSITHVAVSQHCVKEGLKTRQRGIM